jgi:hypothetical protein
MSTSDGFAPQAEEMDLSALYAHTYVVAVSTGDRDDGRLLAKTMHGPYGFDEMVGEVGRMWTDSQDNAKVYILEKDPLKKSKWLDSKTIDYIQDKYMDIIMARIIGNDEPKKYTVQAGIVEETQTEVSQEVPS